MGRGMKCFKHDLEFAHRCPLCAAAATGEVQEPFSPIAAALITSEVYTAESLALNAGTDTPSMPDPPAPDFSGGGGDFSGGGASGGWE